MFEAWKVDLGQVLVDLGHYRVRQHLTRPRVKVSLLQEFFLTYVCEAFTVRLGRKREMRGEIWEVTIILQ